MDKELFHRGYYVVCNGKVQTAKAKEVFFHDGPGMPFFAKMLVKGTLKIQ